MPNAKDQLFRFWTGVHERLFRATNGRILGRVAGMPVLALTTTGRKSGKKRTTMLTSPVQSSDEKAELWPKVVASYRGYAGYRKRTDRDIPLVILEP